MTDPSELIGTRVSVHYNLTRGGFVISSKPKGKLLAYVDTVTLTDASCVVRESTRQRVINGYREVHAWVVGTLESVSPVAHGSRKLTYNPYRCGSFTIDGEPVSDLPRVTFEDRYGWITETGEQQ